MATQITAQDVQIITQHEKEIYVRANLLNRFNQIIDTLDGVIVSADVQIDANSPIRRTANISISNYKSGQNHDFWINKRIQIYVGYKHQITKEILWYKTGTFLLSNISESLGINSDSISLQCSDLMSKLNGDAGGKINATEIVIPAESNIRNVIISLLTQNTEFTDYLIDDFGDTVPYDLEFGTGTTVYDIIDKLTTLYPNWEKYFDVDGVFVVKPIPSGSSEPNFVDYSFFDECSISESSNINVNEVKNVITIWGANGLNSTWKDENVDSPYYVGQIGEIEDIFSGEEFDDINTQDLCDQRSAYEGWIHTRMNDSITLDMLAVPWFNVNKKLTYKPLKNNQNSQVYEYITKSINLDLSTGTMSLTMIRYYPLYPEILNIEFIHHLY